MENFYIESQNKKLYTIYHEPPLSDNNSKGVVLCYPLGHEYLRCHKLYVTMAQRLSKKGFHLIRFDYYGTGDSNGNFTDGSVTEWIDDISLVINELKNGTDINEIILVGIRLGANLALHYAKQNKVDKLVLWSPVIDYNKYLKFLETDYENWLLGSFTKLKTTTKEGFESYGFTYSQELINDIRNISPLQNNLETLPIMLIGENDDQFIGAKQNSKFHKMINTGFWNKNDINKSLVPVQELEYIENWI